MILLSDYQQAGTWTGITNQRKDLGLGGGCSLNEMPFCVHTYIHIYPPSQIQIVNTEISFFPA